MVYVTHLKRLEKLLTILESKGITLKLPQSVHSQYQRSMGLAISCPRRVSGQTFPKSKLSRTHHTLQQHQKSDPSLGSPITAPGTYPATAQLRFHFIGNINMRKHSNHNCTSTSTLQSHSGNQGRCRCIAMGSRYSPPPATGR